MILAEYIDPCQQIRHAIIRHLQGLCGGFARPLPQTQIRGVLDVSGDPKDSAGIVVGCDNAGEHWGANNRGILIDVSPRIVCFSHINEDADGSICNALVSDVANAIRSIHYDGLLGWEVKWNGNWMIGEYTMDGSYRQCEMSARLPLVRLFDIDNSHSEI